MKTWSIRSRNILLLAVVPAAYVVVWLGILPILADVSAKAAILSLSIISSAVCAFVAKEKGRDSILWGIAGAISGFLELGILAVIIIIALPHKTVLSSEPAN